MPCAAGRSDAGVMRIVADYFASKLHLLRSLHCFSAG